MAQDKAEVDAWQADLQPDPDLDAQIVQRLKKSIAKLNLEAQIVPRVKTSIDKFNLKAREGQTRGRERGLKSQLGVPKN